MELVHIPQRIRVRLHKNLARSIKRGHAWLYSDAVEIVRAASGSVAVLADRQDVAIACGIYDPQHPIPLRICRTDPPFELDDTWLSERLARASALRRAAFDETTTGFRLVAGEGDGMPGLIVDVYDKVAVLKLDGGAPESFYRPQGIAEWLKENWNLECVILRKRERGRVGQVLIGQTPTSPIAFLENGLRFSADVMHGQKTGFFLDQRDNRAMTRRLSRGKRVLNLFCFSGGFSIAAGQGGAAEVTSVDIAAPAIEAAEIHWQQNELRPVHRTSVSDCFEFLADAVARQLEWDLVICDPPSFAPNEKARERALAAYSKLAQLCGSVTAPNGLLALASCSSHVSPTDFTKANLDGLGRARRKGTLLGERGLPIDHPTPFAMPELRYLKFQLLQLD